MHCQSPRTTRYPSCPQKGRQCLQFQLSNSCCLIIDSFPESSSWAFSHHFCFKEARRRSLIKKHEENTEEIKSPQRCHRKGKRKECGKRMMGMCEATTSSIWKWSCLNVKIKFIAGARAGGLFHFGKTVGLEEGKKGWMSWSHGCQRDLFPF